MRTQLRNTTKVKSSTQLWRVATIGMVALVVGIVGVIWFQLGTVHTSHANNLPGYDYKKIITIQESEIPGSNALVDFPVLLQFTDADLATTSNGGYVVHSSGYDIRAALADGTLLDQELEHYDPSTGEIVLWVRYPSLSATTDSEIHLYFGNSSVSSDPSSSNTWSSEYNGVYHFDGNTDDATGVYDASRNGTSTANNALIGKGEDFDGNNDFLTINEDAIPSDGGWTISMWVRFNSGGADRQYMFDMRIGNGNDEFSLRYDDDDEEIRWRYMDEDWNRSRSEIEEDAELDDGQWYHMVAIGEWRGRTQELYIDGQRIGNDNSRASASPSRPRPFIIGADQSNGSSSNIQVRNEFDGIMDEVRILNTQLSAAWIETEYNNQSDPGSFFSVGSLFPTNGSLLPIELAYFQAQPTDNGQVELAWETMLEINNEYFTIERSKDGEHFEPIFTEPGQINSSTPTAYVRYDENPLPGYSYYRLKQTDLDGKYEYFPIQEVFIAPPKDDLQITRVYPNPFRAQASVEVLAGYEQTADVQLVDASGRVFWQTNWRLQEGEQRFTIPGASLAKGYYLLHLSTADGQQASVPLLKAE